jgi:hypothetical protein
LPRRTDFHELDVSDHITDTANDLGIPVGDQVKALLDAHSVSIGTQSDIGRTRGRLNCLVDDS